MDIQKIKPKGKMSSKYYRRSRHFQNIIYQGQHLVETDRYVIDELLKEYDQLDVEMNEYGDLLRQVKKDIEDVRSFINLEQ
jgi:hypothetical protein